MHPAEAALHAGQGRAPIVVEDRAAEKAASREADELDIATGARTADQVRRDNASFAFPGARLRFPRRER